MDKYKRITVEKHDGTFIPDDEPVFILRAQDLLAPVTIEFYADLVERIIGKGAGTSIRDVASGMRKWQPRKFPD